MKVWCIQQTSGSASQPYLIEVTLTARGMINRTVQFKMVSMCSEKPTYAPPHLSEVPPTLPLKWFQCSSDWRWPSLVLSRRSSNASSFPLFSRRPVVLCPWSLALWLQVVSQASQHFRPAEKQATCDNVTVALPASLSAQSFSFTPVCPGQYTHPQEFSKVDVNHWHIPAWVPIPLFTFCHKLIQSVRMVACALWLPPLKAVQQRTWATVKLEVETV